MSYDVSIEANSWALKSTEVPQCRRDAPSLVIVLIGLANHGGLDGCSTTNQTIGQAEARLAAIRERVLRERAEEAAVQALTESPPVCNWTASARQPGPDNGTFTKRQWPVLLSEQPGRWPAERDGKQRLQAKTVASPA